MFQIFDFIGMAFGYVLWASFCLVKNYGLAIILFTIIVKIIFFPVSIKQQKSQAATMRLSAKQAELRKKYANNKEKFNEEVSKLYSKEGVNPANGCLTSFLPMFLLLGVYYAVINPLTNTLHFASETVNKAIADLVTLPGIGSSFSTAYRQIDIIRLMQTSQGKDYLGNFFDGNQMQQLQDYSSGFNFLGIDLLGKPSDNLWPLILIPILCFVTSVLSTLFMMKMQGNPMAQQQGCMKYVMLAMPLLSAYIAYTVPAAVGFYWIISTVLGFLNSLALQKFYSPSIMGAKSEAQRIALLEIEEKSVKYDYKPRFLDAKTSDGNNKKGKKK